MAEKLNRQQRIEQRDRHAKVEREIEGKWRAEQSAKGRARAKAAVAGIRRQNGR